VTEVVNKFQGVFLVLVAACAFAALTVLAPLSYREGANPSTLLFLRFTIAGSALTALMLYRRIAFPRGVLLLKLVFMGGVWYLIQSLAYYTAAGLASPGLVALLLYLYPAIVVVISAVFLKEQITSRKWLALALALVGCALTISPSGQGDWPGIILALLAAILYAGYILIGEGLIVQAHPLPALTVTMLSTAASLGGLVAVNGVKLPVTQLGWWAILASAAISIIALGAFFTGLERIGSTNVVILSTIEPLITVIFAWLLLGDRIQWEQLAGGIFILLAVIVLNPSKIEG